MNHEIIESVKRGSGVLGVYIHNVLDQNRQQTNQGLNPFDYLYWGGDTTRPISDTYPTYNWVANDGRVNLAGWIEAAAKKAGK